MDFWNSKKVLVTGADGFVGQHLCAALSEGGASVYAMTHSESSQVAGAINMSCDIRDFNDVRKYVVENNIDTIFHLAAQAIVSEGFGGPLETFQTNVLGTVNVLEAARQSDEIARVVIASTTHVYGDNDQLPYLESYYPRPTRPYETSKVCADMIAQTYFYTYGLPVAIARCSNTYGPGDRNMTRIVPKIMSEVAAGKNPTIIGGSAKRDYLYIDDAVRAYLTLAEQLDREEVRGEAFNFGSGVVLSAVEMAEAIIQSSGRTDVNLIVRDGYNERNKEIDSQYVSTEKAKQILGWRSVSSLTSALQNTYKLHVNHGE